MKKKIKIVLVQRSGAGSFYSGNYSSSFTNEIGTYTQTVLNIVKEDLNDINML